MSNTHVAVAPALNPGVRRREVLWFALYDFANSAYTTIIITAIYNAFFVAEIAGRARWATLAWTSALSLSYALILLSAPVLGRYADQHAAKRRLLALATLLCVAATAALAWVGADHMLLALLLLVVSNFAFGSGENLLAAFLPELATRTGYGRVSGFSWAFGYIGGLIALALCLAYVQHAQKDGLVARDFVPVCLLIAAGMYALGAIPMLTLVPERGVPHAASVPIATLFRESITSLRTSLASLGSLPDLRRFLWAIFAYQAGIQTVITIAAIYAQEAMGFTTAQTLQLILVVNITASIGAAVFGLAQDRFGHRRMLIGALALWLLTILAFALGGSAATFWIAANAAGLAMGAAQAGGRAAVAWLSPAERSGECFGLWGFATKAAAIVGPLAYGLVSYVVHNDHRIAMLATAGFFVVGLLVIYRVDFARGHAITHPSPAQNSPAA